MANDIIDDDLAGTIGQPVTAANTTATQKEQSGGTATFVSIDGKTYAQFDTPAGIYNRLGWNFAAVPRVYLSMYAYIAAGNTFYTMAFDDVDGAAPGKVGDCRIDGGDGGDFVARDIFSAVATASPTGQIPVGPDGGGDPREVRLEALFDMVNDVATVRVWTGGNLNGTVTPTATATGVLDGKAGTSFDNVRLGITSGAEATMNIRRVRASSTEWPAPESGDETPPVAAAALTDVQFTVSAAASTDDVGVNSTAWTLVSGGAVTFGSAAATSTTVTPTDHTSGPWVVRATVDDAAGNTDTADVTLTLTGGGSVRDALYTFQGGVISDAANWT